MPSYSPIDYATPYFPTLVIPKIVGQPNFENLRTLKKALKANAASVQSDLGGGLYGHLGLVLDDATYYRLTQNHYVAPVHPGQLVIPDQTALHEAVRRRDEHNDNIRLFRETIDVKNALMKQIISTIEPRFIKELKNVHTDSITQSIHQGLTFLITRYGNVDSRRLKQEEDRVRHFSWNIIDPPVVLFNLIEDLEIIAEAAMNEKSNTQLVNYGLDIIRDTGEFETSLLTWYNRPVNDQTWVNFKTHFTTAHRELSKVRGASMRGSAFQQANATVEALTSEMMSIRNELVDSINSLSTVTPPTETVPPTLLPPIEDTNQQMNATTGQQAIIDAIKQLQQQMITLTTNHTGTNNNNNGSTSNNNNGNNGSSGARRTGNRYTRNNTSKYCWSHGGCAHSSSECNAKKEGHQNNATFDNKMGGSTSFCGTRDT
jgi:hypothetical protein